MNLNIHEYCASHRYGRNLGDSRSLRVRQDGGAWPPYAFTEQGVAMLSSVLGSSRVIAVNIEIMRTLARLSQLAADGKAKLLI